MEPEALSPLVQRYLQAFGEVVRFVASAQDVPEALWETMRAAWAEMNDAERKLVERRTHGPGQAGRGSKP